MFASIINSISINNSAVVVKNIMGIVAVMSVITMILMIVAGTICIMQNGWSSREASTCGAIAVCAGMIMYFACNYIAMH